MDEELDMVEDSFSQDPVQSKPDFADELESVKVETLEEFLKVTGTHFLPHVPTSFRRETNSFAIENGTAIKYLYYILGILSNRNAAVDVPTILDYAKAATLWFSELEIYEFGCKELSQYIESGKASLKAREDEIMANTPLIFYEFSEGTEEERKELMVRLDSYLQQLNTCALKANVT